MKNEANSQDLSAASLKPRIIAVAAGLLSQSKPIKLPTTREIAVSAGVSLGAAYRHFDSQEDLFLAVVTALFEDLESHIKAAAQSSKQPRVSTSVLERCDIPNVEFVWVTDGQGWLTTLHPMRAAYEKLDYVWNLNWLSQGFLSDLFVE